MWTVHQFLDGWLESVRPSLRPGTWTRYEELLRLHVVPEIGHLRLARLTPQDVQRLYAGRLECGLSSTTVRHLHTTLHTALGQAAKWGLVARNVISLAAPPRFAHREMAVLSPEQTRALLDAAAGYRLEALFVLALSTEQAQERLQLGASWEDNDLLFTDDIGRSVSPWILIRHFHALLEKAVEPKIRFHDLRHTATTLLLGQGVHPKIVSEMLGHSNIGTTLDLYSHVTPVMQRQAADVMDTVLAGS